MLKKILVLIALVSIASCSSKMKQDSLVENQDDFKVEESMNNSMQDSYKPLESEQDAKAMNDAAKAQEDEVEVKDRIFFAYDSSELSDDARKILEVQAMWLKSDPSINITVEGHCDERGTREYNIALGERRANAAKDFLISNGVQTSRIKTVSYGKEHPIYFGSEEEVISKNRRAVTVVN